VRDAAIVAFPDRRTGAGLYAFVESDEPDASLLRDLAATTLPAPMPERLQVVRRLPRDPRGALRIDILQLIAMNQIDLIEPLIATEAEKEIVALIVADRRNLRDRYVL
jgi:acyl-coenzyme A synthetase/AMP-(fatty) acid ligase